MSKPSDNSETLLKTPLHALHLELGGKMVPFAGYDMPVQYPLGIMKEHLHVRDKAGLFDVSHMGPTLLIGPDHDTVASALETLLPGLYKSLKPGRVRYGLLMNDNGGIIDDMMVTRFAGEDGQLMLVLNASRKEIDCKYLRENLPENIEIRPLEQSALLALQGPVAVEVVKPLCPEAAELGFMTAIKTEISGIPCAISRSGYTGEDGYEILVDADKAEELARLFLSNENVQPIGLGARDSLRLEAGMCLYGHDIDETTSPVEADLMFAVGKRRREAGDFKGADRVLNEIANGTSRKRVCIKLNGRAPAREGAEIQSTDGKHLGTLTSGGFAPTVGGPIAMGYVETAFSKIGANVNIIVRGRALEAEVVTSPFTPHRYFRKQS